jgi:CubicO group peptidase (beta-lactamase class C family)
MVTPSKSVDETENAPNCSGNYSADVARTEAVTRTRKNSRLWSNPEKGGLDKDVLQKTDEALHARVDRGELPGLISLVVRNGELAHLDCYGYSDLERKLPMRPDSIVRLYSMSKNIVSVAVATCMEEGLLALEDPVAKFIPAFAKPIVRRGEEEPVAADRPITILHLLTHTSGIGYGPMLGDEADGDDERRYTSLIARAGLGRTNPADPSAITTLEHWCNEIATIPLTRQPGTDWVYSYSHDVIGRVLEVVCGQPLDVVLHKRIFEPLCMVDTGFEVPKEKWDRVAGMYRRHEVEQSCDDATIGGSDLATEETQTLNRPVKYILERIDAAELDRHEWMIGNTSPILAGGGSVDAMTGGLVSTAADYSRFLLMLLRWGELGGVQLLQRSTVELLTTNLLPRVTGRDDVWALSTVGLGFGIVGSVSVAHEDLDPALRPTEYGWGGMVGTAWTNDPTENFSLLSFSLVAFDLTTEEDLRAGVREAISKFNEQKQQSPPRRNRFDRLSRKASTEKQVEASTDHLTRLLTPVRRRRLPLVPSNNSIRSVEKVQKTIQKAPRAKSSPTRTPPRTKLSPRKLRQSLRSRLVQPHTQPLRKPAMCGAAIALAEAVVAAAAAVCVITR